MRKSVLRVTDGGVSGIMLVKAELMENPRCRIEKFVWPLFCLDALKLDEFSKVLKLGGEYYCVDLHSDSSPANETNCL
jgi:hypothetical protein